MTGDRLGLDVMGLAVIGAEVSCMVMGDWLGLDVTRFRVGIAVIGAEFGCILMEDWLRLNFEWGLQ